MSQQKICTCGAADYNSQLPQNGGVSFQPTSGQTRRPTKPPTAPAKDEVYVFIRARNEHYPVMKNFMVLESKIIDNYHGTIIGLADQVNVVEAPEGGSSWVSPSTEKSRYCMFVLLFDCIRNARLWSVSDRVFKQQDCLPPNEMIEGFIVPLKHLPPEDCRTFLMMTTTNVRDPQSFQEGYIDQVVPLLNESRVEQGVVSTDEVETLRRSWVKKGDFIFIHQARSASDLGAVFQSEEYARIRECRDNWADCEALVFTVSLDPFKPRKRPQQQWKL